MNDQQDLKAEDFLVRTDCFTVIVFNESECQSKKLYKVTMK